MMNRLLVFVGIEMNNYQAHALLNQLKLGMYVSPSQVNEALFTTGDLDVRSIAPKVDQPLCTDGDESFDFGLCKTESFRDATGSVRPMGWSRYLNQATN